MNPRFPWYFWVILSGILLGLSALIGGCTEGRAVTVSASRIGGVTTYTTVAAVVAPAAVPAPATPAC